MTCVGNVQWDWQGFTDSSRATDLTLDREIFAFTVLTLKQAEIMSSKEDEY